MQNNDANTQLLNKQKPPTYNSLLVNIQSPEENVNTFTEVLPSQNLLQSPFSSTGAGSVPDHNGMYTPHTANSASKGHNSLSFFRHLSTRSRKKSFETNSLGSPKIEPNTVERDRQFTELSTQSEALHRTGTNSNPPAAVSEHMQKKLEKRFPELVGRSVCIGTYLCSLEKDLHWHGTLYVLNTHVCFYGKFFTKSYRVVIPLEDVVLVERKAKAKVFHNALKITTRQFSYLFSNFLHRDAAYKDVTQTVQLARLRPFSHLNGFLRATHAESGTWDAADDSTAFLPGVLKKSVSLPNAHMAIAFPSSISTLQHKDVLDHSKNSTLQKNGTLSLKSPKDVIIANSNVSASILESDQGTLKPEPRLKSETLPKEGYITSKLGQSGSSSGKSGSKNTSNSLSGSLYSDGDVGSVPSSPTVVSSPTLRMGDTGVRNELKLALLEDLRSQFPIETVFTENSFDPFLAFMYLHCAKSPLIASLHDFFGRHVLEAIEWCHVDGRTQSDKLEADMLNEIKFTHVCQLPISHKVASTTCDMLQKVRIAQPNFFLSESRIAFKNIPLADQFRAVGVHYVFSTDADEAPKTKIFIGFRIEFTNAARFGQQLVQKLATDALLTLYKDGSFLFDAFLLDSIGQTEFCASLALQPPLESSEVDFKVQPYKPTLTDKNFFPAESLLKIQFPLQKSIEDELSDKQSFKKSSKMPRKKHLLDSSSNISKLHIHSNLRGATESIRKQRKKLAALTMLGKHLQPAACLSGVQGSDKQHTFIQCVSAYLVHNAKALALVLVLVVVSGALLHIFAQNDILSNPSASQLLVREKGFNERFLEFDAAARNQLYHHNEWISRYSGISFQFPKNQLYSKDQHSYVKTEILEVVLDTRIQQTAEEIKNTIKIFESLQKNLIAIEDILR